MLKQDIKSEMNPMMSPRPVGSDGSLIGVHGIVNTVISFNFYACVMWLITVNRLGSILYHPTLVPALSGSAPMALFINSNKTI